MRQVGITVFYCLLAARMVFAGSPDARDIVRRADEHARGKSSQAEVVIRIVRPDWSREMSMKIWSKGNDRAMILVTAPARDMGTAFLKRGKEVWNWIPSIERNIKLPPSMMSQSWMGTDFTNDDLVKEASIVEDYIQSLEGEERVGDRSCYRIRMIPAPEAAVVWGRVMLWIDTKDYLMLKAEYYDEDGVLVNTMTCSDIRSMGGRLLPARMEMKPADKPGHKTELLYRSLVFDQPVQDDFFSARNMPRLK